MSRDNTDKSIRPGKGERGYLDSQHRSSLVRFLIPCVITLILTLCTWVIFPQYGMVFLVLAVISAIPTAMAAVNLIMFLRFKSVDYEVYERIEEVRGIVPVLYDSVITTTEKSYFVPCIAVINKNTLLLFPDKETDDKELLRHLNLMSKKNGFREWNIKSFRGTDEFIKRLKYLNEQKIKVLTKDGEMIKLISNLSL